MPGRRGADAPYLCQVRGVLASGVGALARPPIEGARAVASFVRESGAPFAPLGRPAMVNGSVGVLVGPPEKPLAVIAMTIVGERIVEMDLIGDPAKLERVKVAR